MAPRSLLVPAIRPGPLDPGVTPDPQLGCWPLIVQLLTRSKPRSIPGACQALPIGRGEGRRKGRGGRGEAASSPAGDRHLHPRRRDGRAQLVQVPDARGAGVAAVHLAGRRRGLVRRPLPELEATEVSELSSRQTGIEVEGGGSGRRRQLAASRREEAGRSPRAAPREPRVSPGGGRSCRASDARGCRRPCPLLVGSSPHAGGHSVSLFWLREASGHLVG